MVENSIEDNIIRIGLTSYLSTSKARISHYLVLRKGFLDNYTHNTLSYVLPAGEV